MENKKSLESIQILRGLAACLVVFAHAFGQFNNQEHIFSPRTGHIGVDIFFVISGFVMVYVTQRKPVGPVSFMKNRFVRIAPMYWLVTTALLLVALASPKYLRGTEFGLSHYIQSLLFIPHINPATGSFSPMLRLGWTLNFEMFFYVLFALGLLIWRGRNILLMSMIILAFGAIFPFIVREGLLPVKPTSPFYFYANSIVCEFAYGMILAYVYGRKAIFSSPLRTAMAVVACTLVVAGFLVELPFYEEYRGFVFGIPAFVIVSVFLSAEDNFRKLKSGWIHVVGDASYSIYLTHLFVLSPARIIWVKIWGSEISWYWDFVFVGISSFFAILTGCAIYKLLEKPLVTAFSKRLK